MRNGLTYFEQGIIRELTGIRKELEFANKLKRYDMGALSKGEAEDFYNLYFNKEDTNEDQHS